MIHDAIAVLMHDAWLPASLLATLSKRCQSFATFVLFPRKYNGDAFVSIMFCDYEQIDLLYSPT